MRAFIDTAAYKAPKTKRFCSGDNPNLTRKAFAESSTRYIAVTKQPLSGSSKRSARG
jgi:hypothetical protein